jgi:hypothetical protein
MTVADPGPTLDRTRMVFVRALAATRKHAVVSAVLALVLAGLLAGCGSSSKPSYCASVTNLENSIKAVPSTNVVANGTTALESAFTKIKNDANALISSAKTDFPTETSALKSSIDSLSSTVEGLKGSPSAATLAALAGQASAVVTAADNFTSATKSKCG